MLEVKVGLEVSGEELGEDPAIRVCPADRGREGDLQAPVVIPAGRTTLDKGTLGGLGDLERDQVLAGEVGVERPGHDATLPRSSATTTSMTAILSSIRATSRCGKGS